MGRVPARVSKGNEDLLSSGEWLLAEKQGQATADTAAVSQGVKVEPVEVWNT